jgi:hypothetical protein
MVNKTTGFKKQGKSNTLFGCKELAVESENLELGISFRRLVCAVNWFLETERNSEPPPPRV